MGFDPISAVLGGGSAALGFEGSSKQADAATQAAQAQLKAQEDALAFQKQVYGDTKAQFKPYVDIGTQTLPMQEWLATGVGTPFNIQDSPIYQWEKERGLRDINRELSSRRLYDSGAGLQTIEDYLAQINAREMDKLYNRVSDISNLGMGAVTSGTGAATNQGRSIADIFGNIGGAQAGGILGAGQARAGFYNNLGNMFGQAGGLNAQTGFGNSLWNNWFGGGGGGGMTPSEIALQNASFNTTPDFASNMLLGMPSF